MKSKICWECVMKIEEAGMGITGFAHTMTYNLNTFR